MKCPKLLITTLLATVLLACLQSHELRSLVVFKRSPPAVKLSHFEQAKKTLKGKELESLKLWESLLTGRSRPLSKLMKEKYQDLGLLHLFTPSGFHLSALLSPVMRILPTTKFQLLLLIVLGSSFFFLPGFLALKRMILIKFHQKLLGKFSGFVLALLIDMLFGSFQEGPRSFTYSFLFLGIVYSGKKGLTLIIWFYFAQMILSYFQAQDISPILILVSPLINLLFAFILPLLLLLSFPLWAWQLHIGLYLLGFVSILVDTASSVVFRFPFIEVNLFTLLMMILLIYKKPRWVLPLVMFMSFELNSDGGKIPSFGKYEFIPRGQVVQTEYKVDKVVLKYQDGKCDLKLVRGQWWENCSPRRGSRNKKLRKLSYL